MKINVDFKYILQYYNVNTSMYIVKSTVRAEKGLINIICIILKLLLFNIKEASRITPF